MSIAMRNTEEVAIEITVYTAAALDRAVGFDPDNHSRMPFLLLPKAGTPLADALLDLIGMPSNKILPAVFVASRRQILDRPSTWQFSRIADVAMDCEEFCKLQFTRFSAKCWGDPFVVIYPFPDEEYAYNKERTGVLKLRSQDDRMELRTGAIAGDTRANGALHFQKKMSAFKGRDQVVSWMHEGMKGSWQKLVGNLPLLGMMVAKLGVAVRAEKSPCRDRAPVDGRHEDTEDEYGDNESQDGGSGGINCGSSSEDSPPAKKKQNMTLDPERLSRQLEKKFYAGYVKQDVDLLLKKLASTLTVRTREGHQAIATVHTDQTELPTLRPGTLCYLTCDQCKKSDEILTFRKPAHVTKHLLHHLHWSGLHGGSTTSKATRAAMEDILQRKQTTIDAFFRHARDDVAGGNL